MAANIFTKQPYQRIRSITASDSANVSGNSCDAVLCLTAGTAQIVDTSGTQVAVPMIAGQILPLRVKRIKATSTTGTYAALYFQ